jgi:hypothetical protein
MRAFLRQRAGFPKRCEAMRGYGNGLVEDPTSDEPRSDLSCGAEQRSRRPRDTGSVPKLRKGSKSQDYFLFITMTYLTSLY